MSKSAVERPVDRPEQTIAGTLRRHGRHIMANWIRELALLPVIVLLLVVGAFVNPAFLTADNFINVAQESAALGAVVAAESLILLTGKFDLSLQATYGLAPMVGAWLIVSKDGQGLGSNWNPFLGIAIVLLVGLAVGAFNGFMVIKLGFNAFIFTLAMLILLTGIQVGIVSGRTIYHLPAEFIYLGSQYILGIPVSVWITGAIFLLSALFLRYHRIGRAIYAIGGNTEAARADGWRPHRRHLVGAGPKHPDPFTNPDVLDRRRQRPCHPDRPGFGTIDRYRACLGGNRLKVRYASYFSFL